MPVLLDWRIGFRCSDGRDLPNKQSAICVGVEEPEVRAQLIGEGFGGALPMEVALVELTARLLKLEVLERQIPRQQRIGPVLLDLFHRDAKVAGKWVGLHPREFGLLWRLGETPHRPVGKKELLRDVWRLEHEPETNSLEVHVSRLRAKLSVNGVGWVVQTHEGVGYQAGTRHSALGRISAGGQGAADRAGLWFRTVEIGPDPCQQNPALRLTLPTTASRRSASTAPTR